MQLLILAHQGSPKKWLALAACNGSIGKPGQQQDHVMDINASYQEAKLQLNHHAS